MLFIPSLKTSAPAAPLLLALLCNVWPANQQAAAVEQDVRVAGHWVRDKSASDDFDAKVSQLMSQRQRRARPAQPPPTEGDVPPLAVRADDTIEQARLQFVETLKPADELRIGIDGSMLTILADDQPLRRFTFGQSVTRMDASGTAEVTATMSGSTLHIRARYANRALRTYQYGLDRSGDLLRMTMIFSDPQAGRLEIHSTYRRGN